MLASKKLKVLVVDDTVVYRKTVSDIIAELPEIEVVGVAHNGKIAMSKIATLKPDLITLDIEMPEMNGLEVLAELQKQRLGIGAIMLSTLTADGSEMTMKALELGAFDFILKPQAKNLTEGKDEIRRLIHPMIQAYARSKVASSLLGNKHIPSRHRLRRKTAALQTDTPSSTAHPATIPPAHRKGKSEIITIGVSTGGPNALTQMLSQLPADLGVPIVIVQHMPPIFTKSLAQSLDKKSALSIKEAENGEVIKNNFVYIAPGGKQMKLIASNDGKNRLIKLTNDPPENSCKPSVDYLFRSVGDYYVGRSTAVIMTGMGSDGTKGLEILKNKGSFIIAQNEDSCVVYGMPKAPIELGLVNVIAPLNRLADEIVKTVRFV